MPTNYILLDFENTQPEDLTPLEGTAYQLRVFLGSHQTKLPSTLAIQMQHLGDNADYIQIEGHGRNALDFHIAYYMGKLAAEDPGSRFQVISKDTGFDVLLEHLRKQGIACARLSSLAELAEAAVPQVKTLADKLTLITDQLTRMKAAKPRSLKTLRSTIGKKCLDGLSERELDQLIDALQKQEFLVVEITKVRYASDGAPSTAE